MQSTPSTAPRQKLLLVAFGLVVAVGLVVAIEGVLALLGLGEPDERYADPYVGFDASTSLFARAEKDGEAIWRTRPEKLRFFNEQSFAVDKAPGTYRVFTLGGSTVAGRPYDDHVAFGSWLERWLDQAEPERRHEVINAGAISYASYRVARLMEELVDYRPDLFVVLTGHNEFLEERTYRTLRAEAPGRQVLRSRLARLRLARLVWAALDDERSATSADAEAPATVLSDEVETRLDVWTGLQAYERDDALRAQVVEHFEHNLRRMVALARRHEVDLVLVVPASNLRDFSPFKSEHDAALGTETTTRADHLLAEGRALLDAGRSADAVRSLATAAELDPLYAETWFRLGRARLAEGATEDAVAALVAARETDVAPLRAITPLVEAVRRVTADESVPVVDLPSIFAAESRRRSGVPVPGDDLFLDHVHPTIEMHARIAEEVLDLLAERDVVTSAGDAAARVAVYDRVVDGLDRAYHARRDLNLGKVLGWAGKLAEAEAPLVRAREVLDGDLDLHLTLGTLWQKTGRLDAAAVELERAVALAPDSAEAHFNLGVVLGRLDRPDEAARAFTEARRLRDGDYPEASYNLGMLYRAAGRFAEADAAFADALAATTTARRRGEVRTQRAIALAEAGRRDEAIEQVEMALAEAPDLAAAHYARGRLHVADGDAEAAISSYRRALAADPDHALARNNLALVLAGRGDLDAAREELERAVATRPGWAEAYLNLGVVLDRSGQPAEAIRAVETAAELRPDDPRVRLALGLLYFAVGRADDARHELSAASAGGLRPPPDIARELELPTPPSAGS